MISFIEAFFVLSFQLSDNSDQVFRNLQTGEHTFYGEICFLNVLDRIADFSQIPLQHNTGWWHFKLCGQFLVAVFPQCQSTIFHRFEICGVSIIFKKFSYMFFFFYLSFFLSHIISKRFGSPMLEV